MPRSSSAEPAPKQSKRKGTRSVSTLTPTQLARKRANDREAQRAIRARTKEHIERLERELAELKTIQCRDKTVQELLRRNKVLEEELARLREHLGIPVSPSPYSAPVYDDNLSSGSGTVNSPRMSPLPSGDYSHLQEYSQPYAHLPNSCESWAASVPALSNVSSPSSPGQGDEYGTTYIPTSVPNSMMAGAKEPKLEYDDMEHNDAGFRLNNSAMSNLPASYLHASHQQHQHQHQHQQQYHQPQHAQQRSDSWVYPVYYPGQLGQRSQATACVSR